LAEILVPLASQPCEESLEVLFCDLLAIRHSLPALNACSIL
jgi:hypothetical protein